MPKPDEIWNVTPLGLTMADLLDPATCPHVNAVMGRLEQGISKQQPWVDVSKPRDVKNQTWTCKDCGQVGHIVAHDQGE